MRDILTITSKGQTTFPAAIRQKLGLGSDGGILQIRFDEERRQLVVSKPLTIDELSERTTRLIRPGTKPLLNVDEYYQQHRLVRP